MGFFDKFGFQFHKGTIKTGYYQGTDATLCNFNSIKVQLRRCFKQLVSVSKLFQFHKGTIKTLVDPRGHGATSSISIP